ncbi:MAG: hypothetical protein V3R49_00440 [Gammaproteobacteria bacterium]
MNSLTLTVDLAIADGGTGASNAVTARSNLGLEIGVDIEAFVVKNTAWNKDFGTTAGTVLEGDTAFQPLDAGLTSIAGLVTAADTMIYTTALDTYATTGFTAFGRDFVDSIDAAAGRTVLGLGTIATFAGDQNLRSTDDVNFDIITAAGRLRTDSTAEAFSTVSAALQTDGGLGVVKNIVFGGKIRAGSVSVLIISAGAITITTSFHKVDTEGAAATDDLVTINGGSSNQRLIIMSQFTGRTVVVKDGTGNLRLNGDFSMDAREDTMELVFINSVWNELSRSNNG